MTSEQTIEQALRVAKLDEFRDFGFYEATSEPWDDDNLSVFMVDRWEDEVELVFPKDGLSDGKLRQLLWTEIEGRSQAAGEVAQERDHERKYLGCDR